MPDTPEWRKALRDTAAVLLGVFIVINETAIENQPRDVLLYVAVVFIVGPVALRSFGK